MPGRALAGPKCRRRAANVGKRTTSSTRTQSSLLDGSKGVRAHLECDVVALRDILNPLCTGSTRSMMSIVGWLGWEVGCAATHPFIWSALHLFNARCHCMCPSLLEIRRTMAAANRLPVGPFLSCSCSVPFAYATFPPCRCCWCCFRSNVEFLIVRRSGK